MEVKYAVLRQPKNVLVGIEPDGFNVIRLGEDYGEGNFTIMRFEDGKLGNTYNQVVDRRVGPAKRTDQVSSDPGIVIPEPPAS